MGATPNPSNSAIRGPPIPQTTRWLPAVVDQHIAPAANGLRTDHGKEGEMYRGREQRGREVGPFRGIDTYFVYHLIDAVRSVHPDLNYCRPDRPAYQRCI